MQPGGTRSPSQPPRQSRGGFRPSIGARVSKMAVGTGLGAPKPSVNLLKVARPPTPTLAVGQEGSAILCSAHVRVSLGIIAVSDFFTPDL